MALNDEQKQILLDQGWQEHNPPKPGLWSKMFGQRLHYVDCRGHWRAYSFNEDGQGSPSDKGNKMLTMIKALADGQKGLGDF
ncbi:MAG: hypothetical protein ACTSSE_08635 [Candidatus Thorarchaeota archaeon]